MANPHHFPAATALVLAAALSLLPARHEAQSFEPDEAGIYAVFDTSMGEFTAKLAYDAVPLTTANFIGLAEGKIPRFDPQTGQAVEAGPYYDGMIFHRVIDGVAIWSGDPDPDDFDLDGPGYRIPDEMHPNLSHSLPYVISMWNEYRADLAANGQVWEIGNNTGGSEFFITIEPEDGQSGLIDLDGHNAVFGVIVDGTETLEAIGDVEVGAASARPTNEIVLNSVTILRHGQEAKEWSIQDLELPSAIDATRAVDFGRGENGDAFQFPAAAGEDFIVRTSTDLQSWTSEILNTPDNESSVQELPVGEAPQRFLQLQSIRPPNASYEERIPNATLAAQISSHPFHPGTPRTWTFSFNDNVDNDDREDLYGTVTVPELPNATIYRYEYHRLPGGARLRVATQSFQVMTFYLRFTNENQGGYLVWVDDFFNGTSATDPLRFPLTGVFEFTRP